VELELPEAELAVHNTSVQEEHAVHHVMLQRQLSRPMLHQQSAAMLLEVPALGLSAPALLQLSFATPQRPLVSGSGSSMQHGLQETSNWSAQQAEHKPMSQLWEHRLLAQQHQHRQHAQQHHNRQQAEQQQQGKSLPPFDVAALLAAAPSGGDWLAAPDHHDDEEALHLRNELAAHDAGCRGRVVLQQHEQQQRCLWHASQTAACTLIQ
jgi:hypothetical protein